MIDKPNQLECVCNYFYFMDKMIFCVDLYFEMKKLELLDILNGKSHKVPSSSFIMLQANGLTNQFDRHRRRRGCILIWAI